MVYIFDVGVPAISKHLKNIFSENELEEKVVVSKMENTTRHGAIENKTQKSEITLYNLDVILKNNKIEELYVCGIATDLAVLSAVRDAHDKDYIVNVVEDCCGANNEEDHKTSLLALNKISNIGKEDEIN